MPKDYIPPTESGVAAWAGNFSGLINSTPGAYGLMNSDAATINTSFQLFNDALTLVLNPMTKTKGTVADKNAKKLAMLATLRQYAQVIKRNLGVSNQAKIDLGLTINDSGRSPVPAPTTVPVLAINPGMPLTHLVDFRDVTTPDRRAKPAGVTGMILAVMVGTTPPTGPTGVPIYGIATRQGFLVQFDDADKGKMAYYYGRWVTGAGLVGPWSLIASLMISG